MQNRSILPLAIPLAAALAAGIIIFVISRILLFVYHNVNALMTPPVALIIAALVLVGASLAAARVSHIEEH